jgi:hypothetical protein
MLGFLHLPRNKVNYSHMKTINNIIIFKRMDCKGNNGIKCKPTIVTGITARSKCMRDGIVVLMEMQRFMMRVTMCCYLMIPEAARILPSPSSSSRSLPGVVFHGWWCLRMLYLRSVFARWIYLTRRSSWWVIWATGTSGLRPYLWSLKPFELPLASFLHPGAWKII